MKTLFACLFSLLCLTSYAQTSPRSTTATKPTTATATPASSATSAQASSATPMSYRLDILVQEYRPGQPFPGLLFESPGVPNRIGPYAIVFARSLKQYILIFPGQLMQVSSPDYYGRVDCIGPIPAGYTAVK